MNHLSKFTNKYSISKTLRFELVPQGETLNQIKEKGLLLQDENRAKSYQEMKKTIDEYHKWFIEQALKNVNLENLETYTELYFVPKEQKDKDEKFNAVFDKVKADLRKEIVKKFSEGSSKEVFKRLFQKELLKDDLEDWVKKYKPDAFYDEGFKNFTTYFTGFHENRKNMYGVEEQSTAIAYRIVHENLPKFLDNVKIFNEIASKDIDLDFTPILTEMEEVIQGEDLETIFSVPYFSNLLSQSGINFFNTIVGGVSLEGQHKIKGLNEYINLYNQQQKDKKNRIPKFKQLYKQILSDRTSISFLQEQFEDDSQVFDTINDFYKACLIDNQKDGQHLNVLAAIQVLMGQVASFDLDKIYLRNDLGLTNISQKIFGDYGVFKTAMSFYYDAHIDPDFIDKIEKKGVSEKKIDALQKQKANWCKNYISIHQLQKCLDGYVSTLDKESAILVKYSGSIVADYFKEFFDFEIATKAGQKKTYNYVSHIQEQYKGIEGMLNLPKEDLHLLVQDKERAHQLKVFLDCILSLLRFIKPLHCKDDSITERDEKFYSDFDFLYEQLNELTPLYNKVRNYLTQKPYQTEKFKLNFENAQLLNGWDQNKEVDNTSVLLRKDGKYFLAIMNKKSNKIFQDLPKETNTDKCFEKIVYKLLPGANKMLPKVFFSTSNIDFFDPSDEVLRIRNTATHSKNGEPQKGFVKADFSLKDCHTLIDFFKKSLLSHKDWKHFEFEFSDTKSYEDISGFYREVEHQGYKITFDAVSEDYINEKVNAGELYLFQIYNKDFSPHSKGTPNLHTLYWKALFDEQNLQNVVYKLNGQAEVFYRKASIKPENRVIHPKNESIKAKNPLKPNQNVFAYDIIKDKRYTVDKFQFHVPITMNFKADGSERINEEVNLFLQNNPDVNIIGLDRGERHLIYLTLVNQKGEILKQESLNTIKSEKFSIETPYHTLLDHKEKKRADAREEWGAIESIKELKEGYISQVVHKIATMMIEHNAIVVMEDLNFGFKRGRFHVEKQVYQKLEKMLIDKLSYLVLKNEKSDHAGGVLNALQLSNKFESFQKMGKQMGFIYYVPAWNTSKIDPATGFVNFFNLKYESVAKAQEFFAKFKFITFNSKREQFEFSFDYQDFTTRADGSRTKWVICANNEMRYFYNRSLNLNKGGYESVNVREALEVLLGEHQIVYADGKDIKAQLVSQNSADFFKKLLKLFAVIASLRHNNGLKGDDERDFILSPVADKTGNFYCSLNAPTTMPQDADANGAYHIAMKGLWILETLSETKTEDLKKVNLSISNKQWLEFIQRGKK